MLRAVIGENMSITVRLIVSTCCRPRPFQQNPQHDCRDTKLLRAVIREDMSMAMVDELIKDITRSVEYLDSHFTINVNDVHKPEGQSLAVSVQDGSFHHFIKQGSDRLSLLWWVLHNLLLVLID